MTHLVPVVEGGDKVSPLFNSSSKMSFMKSQNNLKDTSSSSVNITAENINQDIDTEDIANEWRCIGYVIDRVFLLVTVIIVVVVTPVLLARHDNSFE